MSDFDKDLKDSLNNNNIDDNLNNNSAKVPEEKSGQGNKANLVSLADRTTEEQREIARMGGIRSGEVRKARKTGRELAQQLLSAQLSDSEIDDILAGAKSILGEEKSVYAVMQAKMIQCANTGDVKAATYMRDTAGDKPIDEINVDTNSITPGDSELLKRLAARMGIQSDEQNNDQV